MRGGRKKRLDLRAWEGEGCDLGMDSGKGESEMSMNAVSSYFWCEGFVLHWFQNQCSHVSIGKEGLCE